jgi:hypothetical protein
MKIIKVFVLLLFLAFSALAQDQTLDQITGLFAGTWKMEGREVYEKWEKNADSSFKGKGYNLKDNQEKITEYFEIKSIDGKIYYLATVPNQNNGATVKFALTKSENGEFVFENPEHDFPQKLVYKKLSDREMWVEVSAKGKKGFSFKISKL